MDREALQSLIAQQRVLDDLLALQSAVSLGILDLSDERAAVVRKLNRAGVPVIAWQLLPKEQGYWFNSGNAGQAARRYREFTSWTAVHGLQWNGIGLDIETDIHEMQQLALDRRRLLPALFRRAMNAEALRRAQMAYAALVAQIRADGYRVDSYQMPPIIDEREAGSTLLQRLAGVIDLDVDREVLMLYSSFYRPRGAGVLWSYAPDAQSVGLGVTGGGVEIDGVTGPRFLDWDEFSRDLRLAHRWTQDIHVFSLEGCVQQGYLSRLREFDWGMPATLPDDTARQVNTLRRMLRAALWADAHPWALATAGFALLWLSGHKRAAEARD